MTDKEDVDYEIVGDVNDDKKADANDSSALVSPEQVRPLVLPVIPVSARSFLPTQIAAVGFNKAWEETVKNVLKTPDKMMAIVLLSNGDKEEDSLLDEDGHPLISSYAPVACLVRVLQVQMGNVPMGNVPVDNELICVLQGITRVILKNYNWQGNLLYADAQYPEITLPVPNSPEAIELKAYALSVVAAIKEYIPLNPSCLEEIKQYLTRFNQNDLSALADCATIISEPSRAEQQFALELFDVKARLEYALKLLRNKIENLQLTRNIKETVTARIAEKQRAFFLREQMSEIQRELGITVDDTTSDINRISSKLKNKTLPEEVKQRVDEELARLNILSSNSSEYTDTFDYLNWVADVPWGVYQTPNKNFKKAKSILEEGHEGLKDVKDRIIEFLAVNYYKNDFGGSILLFVGPPGVGKTSIGKSIAEALNLPFYRFSVGGLSDEAEIVGHRRTYLGALPGKFVQALKECKVMNPVIMIDEIDKMGRNRGDPASALLETLDPEQNTAFLDHYLDLRLDLSKCLFICTANNRDSIPKPLLDRMDVISLSGYLAEEKFKIAKKHLLPKALDKVGLTKKQLKINDAAIRKIIDEYAREAGVRNLEKQINRITRKVLVKILQEDTSYSITPTMIKEYLGVAPFTREKTLSGVGIITGLAWTSVGGATLPVESVVINPHKRGFILTGQLGDVMKESANIALSYVTAHLPKLAPLAPQDFFTKATIHLHVPEGATPKDGPSAGITMASSLLSLALNQEPATGFAMTGELTLTGQVLAIGGIREKVMAAKRINITKLIVPLANKEDVADLPDYVREGMEFFYADTYPDVAKILFPASK